MEEILEAIASMHRIRAIPTLSIVEVDQARLILEVLAQRFAQRISIYAFWRRVLTDAEFTRVVTQQRQA